MSDQATREAAADLIERGIDVLHERGWCQHTLEDDAGRVCLVGALILAPGDANCRSTATLALWDEADQFPVDFNNDHSTTVEDVVLTMKRAAASLREVTA